jgi:methylamine---corrinoid protein Co-methyltransferase
MITLNDVMDRIQTGPICKVADWDRMIYSKAKEIAKKYGFKGIYDPKNPVSSDDKLADTVFQAGLEYLEQMGILCVATERIIKLSRDEIIEGLHHLPSTAKAGSGFDGVTYHHRTFEDKTPCITVLGSFGHPMSEELFPLHSQAVVEHPFVDTHVSATLVTAYGLQVRSGTPMETLAAFLETQVVKEAVRRAGRPNIGIYGVELSATAYGNLGGYTYRGYTPDDPVICVQPAELKTDYNLLHKMIHRIHLGGIRTPMMSHSPTVIGGYAGGPDTVVIVNIAGCIGNAIVHQSTFATHRCLDSMTSADTGRQSVWCDSVVDNALTRNTHLIVGGYAGSVAGPYTEMHLYETATRAMSRTVCGCGQFMGVKATHGRYLNHSSPIESWIAAEVVKATAGLKREQVNEAVKVLLPKYEDHLKEPPIGIPFQEGFDIKTLKPTKETRQLLNKVRKELKALGIPLQTYEG